MFFYNEKKKNIFQAFVKIAIFLSVCYNCNFYMRLLNNNLFHSYIIQIVIIKKSSYQKSYYQNHHIKNHHIKNYPTKKYSTKKYSTKKKKKIF